jgi:hypothetical protein
VNAAAIPWLFPELLFVGKDILQRAYQTCQAAALFSTHPSRFSFANRSASVVQRWKWTQKGSDSTFKAPHKKRA